MAHGVKINGTAYGVTGGKCLVGGTSYSIKKGSTIINGTKYSIDFAKKTVIKIQKNNSDTDQDTRYGYVQLNNGEKIYRNATLEFEAGVDVEFYIYVSGGSMMGDGYLKVNGDLVGSTTLGSDAEYRADITGKTVNVIFTWPIGKNRCADVTIE